ncbi:MAG: aminotransferase class I/II-fold pyridoxal phosphate-dependent enzyme [Flavobacteriaceae bacterium]|nr:aminotransferase class I/II-fold pyridoxal phosphate-dependent enzyme [Bacteroidia bacterium]NNK82456.1 aminotransferase class I/II-fold pyridoxal phosphate-dependent enzyme [Flavobacteriaceae bacterium]
MKTRIPLSVSHMSGNELDYIKDALLNNEVTTYGNNITEFEKDLESYLNQNKNVACLSSGTAAIHLALIQLGIGFGDEVICQSFTFCASANPIVYVGAKPIFVDSEIETWNICPIALEEAIKDRLKKGMKPKAIIMVHLYGMPSKIDKILAVANKYDINVIEDAAEALGSSYKGRKCGTFGDFSILSFNGNKIITTSGGGALVCNSIKQKKQSIYFATQARENEAHYEHKNIGYNYRMSNISAGIGRAQLKALEAHINLRRKNNRFYNKLFASIEGVELFKEPNSDFYSNYWLNCITINSELTKVSKEEVFNILASKNIESRPLWKPLHMQPVFSTSPMYKNGMCEKLFNQGLCLPSSSNLKDNDLIRIKEAFNEIFYV